MNWTEIEYDNIKHLLAKQRGNVVIDNDNHLSVNSAKSQEDSSLILDFFSGSGTTAHAVMQLNAERFAAHSQRAGNDVAGIRWILVQLPETGYGLSLSAKPLTLKRLIN
ncbi:MAG: site-specific DNA-methyltransferase [Planctomycetaceae bacterium]|jgi:hypothetical protein|nr:site-specific DNA-methyltransferase [Planctomycetaceae bacterium]